MRYSVTPRARALRPTRIAVAAAAALLVALAGCGGSGNGVHSSAGTQTSSGTGGQSAVVAAAKATLAKDYAGTDRPLPKTGPKAQRGKTVWVLSCTQAGAGCAVPAAGALEAGKAIGWNVKVVDGKGDPAVYNKVIRDATAAHVDGIILALVDCGFAQSPLQQAKAAGIKIFGLFSSDCDDKYVGKGKPLPFDGASKVTGYKSYADFLENVYGKADADYAIAKTDGKAKVVMLKLQGTSAAYHIQAGFEREMAKCAGCSVYEKPYTIQDLLANKLQGFTAAMLTQHPDADVVMPVYDAAVLLGVGAAAQQAHAQGRKLIVLGGEGFAPNIKLIQSGVQTMAVGIPGRWGGWAAIDGLNRVFAGQPQVDPGIGIQVMDNGHALPSGPNGYDGNAKSASYDANYRRIWSGR